MTAEIGVDLTKYADIAQKVGGAVGLVALTGIGFWREIRAGKKLKTIEQKADEIEAKTSNISCEVSRPEDGNLKNLAQNTNERIRAFGSGLEEIKVSAAEAKMVALETKKVSENTVRETKAALSEMQEASTRRFDIHDKRFDSLETRIDGVRAAVDTLVARLLKG